MTGEEYQRYVSAPVLGTDPFVMGYILDTSREARHALGAVADSLGVNELNFMAQGSGTREELPSVGEWLGAIRDSEFVVTDSFHGTVFAILFEVPFVTLPNPDRGSSRVESLLTMLKLRNRLVERPEEAANILHSVPIRWDEVRALLGVERERGLTYLRKSLSA